DGFSDGFELLREDQSFQAANDKDLRGCAPPSPLTPECSCRDTDGDGLSECAEKYLRTHAGIVDSDGDGVPDAMEARYGLEPLIPNVAGIDTDGDGIPDEAELSAGSDPTRRDRTFHERFGYQYAVQAEVQSNGRVCYDFTLSNLQLVTPPSSAGRQQGYNLFKVWFSEAPESGVATDYGVWRTACAWAQYAPPGLRVPLGPELTLEDGNFVPPDRLDSADDYRRRCVGEAP
ncbi:MAG TPA: VWA domain-containing protein, partial [Myxococcaceae bacterium]|nr:VWA domain-containing protein [Myxococcaceae bacterium]